MLCPQTSQRLEIFARASELVATEALTRTRMLRVLQTQIEAYRAEIRESSLNTPITNSAVRCREPVRTSGSDDLFFEGGGPLPTIPARFCCCSDRSLHSLELKRNHMNREGARVSNFNS